MTVGELAQVLMSLPDQDAPALLDTDTGLHSIFGVDASVLVAFTPWGIHECARQSSEAYTNTKTATVLRQERED